MDAFDKLHHLVWMLPPLERWLALGLFLALLGCIYIWARTVM